MPYLSSDAYDHDIFVSYAHVDDRPFFDSPRGREQPIGWVATLVMLIPEQVGH